MIESKIPFNKPYLTGGEFNYIKELSEYGKFSGDGFFTKKCQQFLRDELGSQQVLLTTSCTDALEMASIILKIKPGDEIIMPSYTFVSTCNPFVLRGAKIVFVDVDPGTMNLNEALLKQAINVNTRAIVPVHYAGVCCEMDRIMEFANEYNLYIIEDAAQALFSKYKGKYAGTIGHIGCFSFHDTKNVHCGEGGAIAINDETLLESSEITWEKGTNRRRFLRGEIDKYTWVDRGSSFLPSEINAAFLWAQLKEAKKINHKRVSLWETYLKYLKPLEGEGSLELPKIPDYCEHNGHIFFIKVKNEEERDDLINFLKRSDIHTAFHYIPLHSTPIGREVSTMAEDTYTTSDSLRLLRLPMYYELEKRDVERVCLKISEFFNLSDR